MRKEKEEYRERRPNFLSDREKIEMKPTAVAQYERTWSSKYIGCTDHELDEEFETVTCLELPPPAPGGEDCRFRLP